MYNTHVCTCIVSITIQTLSVLQTSMINAYPSLHSLQVDDLKEKLAAQEVELKQKNEDADALIKRVGIETEKVTLQ